MEKYDKEITKLSTSIILLQCRRTFRSIPIFLSWKGKLAASTKVKIIPTPLLHYFCSAPPEIESQLRACNDRTTYKHSFNLYFFLQVYLLHKTLINNDVPEPTVYISCTLLHVTTHINSCILHYSLSLSFSGERLRSQHPLSHSLGIFQAVCDYVLSDVKGPVLQVYLQGFLGEEPQARCTTFPFPAPDSSLI